MGACSSCLGRSHSGDDSEEDERGRLLFDEAQSNQYGSFGDQNPGIVQIDPLEVQREDEALQKVVANTSNHLVDIFAMVPQGSMRNILTEYPAQKTKSLRYQDVFAKLSSTQQEPNKQNDPLSAGGTPNVSEGWMSEDEDVEEIKACTIKSDDIGPLLGGFADADSSLD